MGGDPQALRRLLTTARARARPGDFPQLAFVQRDKRGRHAANRGLAQSDMDILLGRSIGTYGPIERGQNAPEHLFELIARVLKLNHQEWNSLWRYAVGKEPPFALNTDLGLDVAGSWRLLVDATSAIAYVNDRDWNVLCWNEQVTRLFDGRPVPGNMMRWIMLDPHARTVLHEWDTYWAPAVVAELRAAHALHPESETLAKLVADVRADRLAGPVYEHQHLPYVQPQADAPRPLLHPDPAVGLVWVYVCGAAIFGSPSARLMQFPLAPVDEDGAPRPLPWLRAAGRHPSDTPPERS